MYDLIRSALRSRPHGVVIGEECGAEVWKLIRAAATGHGHSAFTIHAISAEHVWLRFLQVVHAHPDAPFMSKIQIAQSFAEVLTAIIYIDRNPQNKQIVHEIVGVSPTVERTAARPSFSPLFRYEQGQGLLLTGNRPMRPGFRASDLNNPESMFTGVSTTRAKVERHPDAKRVEGLSIKRRPGYIASEVVTRGAGISAAFCAPYGS